LNWGKFITWFFFAIFAVALLTYSVANNTCEQEDLAWEQRIFNEVNQYRVENELQPLERDAFMDELAREQCQYLAEHCVSSDIHFVAHDGFSERRQKIIDTLGATDVSENVAYGPDAAKSWHNSYLHNLNMLNPQWTRAGIGYNGYACMIFSD